MASPVRRQAIDLLTASARHGQYIDHLLADAQTSLQPKDRGLLQEIVYGVLRNKSWLDLVLVHYIRRGYDGFSEQFKSLLRTAVYQMRFLDRVPDHAVVAVAVELAKEIAPGRAGLVNAVLRNLQRKPWQPVKPASENLTALAGYFSHPKWMLKRYVDQFGTERLTDWLSANNTAPATWIRMLQEQPAIPEALEQAADLPGWFTIKSPATPAQILHEQPLAIAQDPGAGLCADLVGAAQGERIIDLCAAPGGKTLVLATQAGSSGTVVAVDSGPRRARMIEAGARRTGLKNIKVEVADARKFTADPADAVLVDAPCSGTGVLARRADLRWQRKPSDFKSLLALQKDILINAAALIKPGGRLIYSTCSIDLEENEQQVAQFLEQFPDFELEPAQDWVNSKFVEASGFLRTWPHLHRFDGAFAARLRKKPN